MSRIVAIIQARVGSTRLPQKILKEIAGKPLLWHVIQRLKKATLITEIIVATTTKEEDKPIIKIASDASTKTFVGSEEDVLDRYYQAAKTYKADIVVRITADCPLIDPGEVDKLVKYFLYDNFDYVSNTCPDEDAGCRQTYPDGLDAEVFSFKALEHAWKDAKLLSEREHVTPYIRKHSEIFKVGYMGYIEDLSHMRWTIDYPEDLTFVREVYKLLYEQGNIFSMKDVLTLLSEHPELKNINSKIIRNEGYTKSLKQDKYRQC